MPFTNCPHCGGLFSARGLYKHIEIKHPEHAVDYKHQFIIRLTNAQRKDLDTSAKVYGEGIITTQAYVVKVLQESGVIR